MAVDGVNAGNLVKFRFDIKHCPCVHAVDGDDPGMGKEIVLLLDRFPIQRGIGVSDTVKDEDRVVVVRPMK